MYAYAAASRRSTWYTGVRHIKHNKDKLRKNLSQPDRVTDRNEE